MKPTHPFFAPSPWLLASLGLLFALSACDRGAETQLEMTLEVKPSGRPGVYLASGTTNLPDHSKLSIAGLRYLQPLDEPAQSEPNSANYAILARETVEVNQGKWQTSLRLWQVAPDGSYQESWQLNQPDLKTALKPAQKVLFSTIFEPENQPPEVNQAFGKLAKKIDNTLIRFTSSGQRYFQTSQVSSVSLPTGKTSPPVKTAMDANDGWGNRSSLEPDRSASSANRPLPLAQEVETTPLSPAQFFR